MGKSNQILFCSDTSGLQIETEEWFSFCKFNCRPGQFYSIWGNIRFCFCPPADILAPYFAVQMCCSRWKMICFVFCPCVLVCPWPHLQRVMMGSICFVFLICLCCVLCFDMCCVLRFDMRCFFVFWYVLCFVFCPRVLVCPHLQRAMMGLRCKKSDDRCSRRFHPRIIMIMMMMTEWRLWWWWWQWWRYRGC